MGVFADGECGNGLRGRGGMDSDRVVVGEEEVPLEERERVEESEEVSHCFVKGVTLENGLRTLCPW
jgi:hypothetical protein